jgi:hypothetical protein
MSVEEAAVAAMCAGMDLLEICHTPEMIFRAYEVLLAEGERSPAFCRMLIQRAERTAMQRAELFGNGVPEALSTKQFEALRKRILHFSEKVMKVLEAQPV